MAVSFAARQQENRRKTIVLMALMASLVAIVIWAAGVYLGYTSVGVVPIAVGILARLGGEIGVLL